MTYRAQIVAEVRAQMSLSNVNVTNLAAATKLTRSLLHSRLSGRTPFTTDELIIVAAALGVTPDEILARAIARSAA